LSCCSSYSISFFYIYARFFFVIVKNSFFLIIFLRSLFIFFVFFEKSKVSLFTKMSDLIIFLNETSEVKIDTILKSWNAVLQRKNMACRSQYLIESFRREQFSTKRRKDFENMYHVCYSSDKQSDEKYD
jgi:hypothetical protein